MKIIDVFLRSLRGPRAPVKGEKCIGFLWSGERGDILGKSNSTGGLFLAINPAELSPAMHLYPLCRLQTDSGPLPPLYKRVRLYWCLIYSRVEAGGLASTVIITAKSPWSNILRPDHEMYYSSQTL